jgi:peroxiredoxin
LSKINGQGASLVAISPQLPDQTADLVAKTNIEFEVLHDAGNRIAKKFGLVFTLAEELRSIYSGFGINLPEANGDESFELPLPATYVIDPAGTILYDFIDTNHTNRLEPDLILSALKG